MSRTVQLILRGLAGLTVLAVLLFVVSGWWRDYQEAPFHGLAVEATSTAPPDAGPADASKDKASGEVVVVLIDGLNLREKPQSDAKTVRGLKKGERLALIKTEGAWYLVKTAEGDEGWTTANPSYSKIEKK